VYFSVQRGLGWPNIIGTATLSQPEIVLSLRRQGDFIVALAGSSEQTLKPLTNDLEEPFYFPFEGPVDVCLYTRSFAKGTPQAVFTDVSIRAEPPR
jgi:hypothetical protein